jgi:hypothetical protein
MSETHHDSNGNVSGWTDDNGVHRDSNNNITGWTDSNGVDRDSNNNITGWTDSNGVHRDSNNNISGYRDDSGREYDSGGGFSGYSSDSGGGDSGGGSSGCYIATATLKGGGSEEQLNILRNWRTEVMRATNLGRTLEAYYDKTGPTVANRAKNSPALSASFLFPFVKPSVWLLKHRSQSKFFKPIYDLLVYAVFLAGLTYGTLIYIVSPKTN